MRIVIDCTEDKAILSSIIATLCKETGYFCYEPRSLEEIKLALAWAETIQFIEPGCSRDPICSANVLNSFAEVFGIALKSMYIFAIDLNEVKAKISAILKSPPQHV